MLKYGNKEFRNLQEQVLKNMNDIQDMMEGATVLAEFGIKVIGQVDDATELPDPATYEGDYGDAYIVGTEEPYEYYIFTRAFEGQEDPQWFDLGIFPQPGPQGEQGPQGETGATPVITPVATTTTLSAGSDASVSVTKSGTNEAPTLTFAFEIPQGAQGIQGPQGQQGLQGPKGDPGDIQSIVMKGVTYEPDESGVVILPAVDSEDISKLQRTVTVVKDAITNLNNYPSAGQNNYSATDVSQGGYTITKILYNNATCSELQAKAYMKMMTGSEFLPEYNYEQPQDCVLLFADGSMWKPQYDSTNGILLYKLGAMLKAPNSAHTSQELVGINTSGETNVLNIGDGLIADNNTLKANILVLDFNTSSGCTVSQEILTKIQNLEYNFIKCNNVKVGSTTYTTPVLLTPQLLLQGSTIAYGTFARFGTQTYTNYYGIGKLKLAKLELHASSVNIYLTLEDNDYTTGYNYQFNVGTATWSFNKVNAAPINSMTCYVNGSVSSRKCLIKWETIDLTNNYYVGFANEYDNTGTLVKKYQVIVSVASGFNSSVTVTEIQ